MSGTIDQLLQGGRRGLIITAAPAETRAVLAAAGLTRPDPCIDWLEHPLNERWSVVQSGVGKVNAALCVARRVGLAGHAVVVNTGVCGSLPGASPAAMLQVVLADRSVYADEGIDTGDRFIDIAAAGFGPGGVPRAFEGVGLETHEALRGGLAGSLARAGISCRVGAVATVSTCSGTDALARAVASRTGAIAEAMEGAAVAHALRRLYADAIRFAELRVVSNTTGDRSSQRWDLKGACATLTRVWQSVLTAPA